MTPDHKDLRVIKVRKGYNEVDLDMMVCKGLNVIRVIRGCKDQEVSKATRVIKETPDRKVLKATKEIPEVVADYLTPLLRCKKPST